MSLDATLDILLNDLAELHRKAQVQLDEAQNFRKLNSGFDSQRETTQLLLTVCEKLIAEKNAVDEATFEEHKSRLAYLCRRYGTSLETGLSDQAYRERFGGDLPPSERPANRSKAKGRNLSMLCCQREFPPHQAWWTEARKGLVPRYQVIRGGRMVQTPSSDLVPGDIAYLRAGQRVAADGRVLCHIDGTTVDSSTVSGRSDDVWVCTVTATADSASESCNIVLRGSYIVSGAVLCLVVRGSWNPLVGGPEIFNPEEEFSVDTSLPPGMSSAQSRSLFRSLCRKARLVCRSFTAVARLTQVQLVIALLSQELLRKDSFLTLVSTAKRLGKTLVLVNCDCELSQLRPLCEEAGVEIMQFNETAAAPGSASATQAMSTTVSEDYSSPGFCTMSEQDRLTTVAAQINEEETRTGSILLYGISEAGLLLLCDQVDSNERPSLFVGCGFNFPRCIWGLFPEVGRSFDNQMTLRLPRVGHVTTASSRRGGSSASPHTFQDVSDSTHPRRSANDESFTLTTTTSNAVQSGGLSPPVKQVMSLRTVDPARFLEAQNMVSEGSRGAQRVRARGLLASMNSIGVLSECADFILIRSDLACLAQALEIVSKADPLILRAMRSASQAHLTANFIDGIQHFLAQPLGG
eukprot:CAMPEP_0170577024 /NCGR_PEP_ID=MMETSP0224-20130122/4703_1 /TAXON_ID=285029 /ORGANISM="Togula jolla, Strain CCCM 725" /LENGTH=634 /DNA_ID=CAMNT_0010899901 /DNA_START=84 /DNA_END=1986 /DNA_ORIENTATION=+